MTIPFCLIPAFILHRFHPEYVILDIEQGLVSILKQLHDDLDAAVFEAYGWPATLSDEEILERLVALNGERAAEEAQGLVRWLRPEYQAPEEVSQAQQVRLIEDEEEGLGAAAVSEKHIWPGSMAEQAAFEGPVTPKQVAGVFDGRRTTSRVAQVAALLETLAALGQAREVEDGRFVGV